MGIKGRRVINKVISSVTALTLVMGMAITPYKTVFADTAEEEEDDYELRYEYPTDSTRLNSVWEKEFSDVPFSERDPESIAVTVDDMEEALCALEEAVNEKGSDEIIQAFIDLCDVYDRLRTYNDTYQVLYYKDMTNETYKNKMTEIDELSVDISDHMLTRLKDIVKVPAFSEALLPYFPKGMIEYLEEYESYDEEYKSLLTEESELVMEYNELSVEMPDDFAERVGEIYIRLVEIRQEQAEILGYDDYIEYSYYLWGREYDDEDLEKLCEYVKEYAIPLDDELLEILWDCDELDAMFDEEVTEQMVWDVVGPTVAQMDPTLEESYNRMINLELVDNSFSESKMDIGFTTFFPYYGDGYIFNSPYGYFQDYFDMFHEFGHFNAELQNNIPSLISPDSLDVDEIKSQALELLSTYYTKDMYGDEAGPLAAMLIYTKVDTIVDGCLYDEFQKAVFREDDLTVDRINEIYEDICEEYGRDPYYIDGKNPDWMLNTHNFSQPFYFVSYAVSALSSLDIFIKGYNDREAGMDTYLKMVSLGYACSYGEVVEYCDLKDIFDENDFKSLMDIYTYKDILSDCGLEVYKFYDDLDQGIWEGDDYDWEYGDDNRRHGRMDDDDIAALIMISVAFVWKTAQLIAALIVSIVIINKGRRKNYDPTEVHRS